MASRCIDPKCENQSSFFGTGALYSFQECEAAHSRRPGDENLVKVATDIEMSAAIPNHQDGIRAALFIKLSRRPVPVL
jgi:hypothetical protein